MNQESRERDSEDISYPQPIERNENGLLFGWDSEINGWASMSGKRVVVLPPAGDQPWRVAVAHQERTFPFVGKDAEARAFAVAEVFSQQEDQ